MAENASLTMRAAVYHPASQKFELCDDVEISAPGQHQVRVKVKYCGLCHSDLSVTIGNPMRDAPPIVVGHEASGVVESVGPAVTSLKPGDHVILTPVSSCGECYYCRRNEHSICVNAWSAMSNTFPDGTTGLSRQGETILRGLGVAALAEYVVVAEMGAIKVGQQIPLETVCVTGCALQTGVGAVLNTARIERGATVVVSGLGGIGSAVVQGARIARASTIVGVDPISERRVSALNFGATHVLDPVTEDVQATCLELTNHIGMDYAFETAGKAALIEQGISLTRMGGTTVIVGSPKFEESLSIPNVVMFGATEKKLCGCMLGSCNSVVEIPRLVNFGQQGMLDMDAMITRRRPLEEIGEGIDDLSHCRGIRTVIEMDSGRDAKRDWS
ncbi:MAG: Zn-dependent alcohol dehydrogenase [Halieaceae bacterium]|nr:Zn-dependent alcohol dehydrogenase [Halieaceae bacterium]